MSRDRDSVQEGKDPLIPFVVTLAGVALLTLNPIGWRIKIGIAALTSTPGLVFTLSEWHLYRDRKREIERLGRQATQIEDNNRQLNRALDAKEAELNQRDEQLKGEAVKIEELKGRVKEEVARRQLEAELQIESKLAEIVRLDATTQDEIAAKKETAERERDRIMEDARRAAADLIRSVELSQANLKAEVTETRRRCAHQLKAARRRWFDMQALKAEEWQSALKADKAEIELARKAIELDRETMQQAIALERAQASEQIANELKDIEKRKADATAEIEALWAEFETEKQAAIEMFTNEMMDENTEKVNAEIRAVNAQLMEKKRELDDLTKAAEKELADKKAELEAFYDTQYQNWLIPHIIELNRVKEEAEDWRSRYEDAEEELASTKDIILPDNPWSQDHKSKAYQLLLWFKSRGVMLNYYNAAIDEEGTFTLWFKPWLGGSKGKKAIEGVIDGMISDWGLAARPFIGETVEAWFIKLVPAANKTRSLEEELRYFGGMPFSNFRVPSTDPRLTEPQSLLDLDEDTRRAVMSEADAQARYDEMLNFRPGKLPKPASYTITPLELKTIDWFCNWRASATRKDPDGGKPNIREVNKLMTEAYGVSIGSSTETRDRNTGEKLRERVHRICKLLKIELRTRTTELN